MATRNPDDISKEHTIVPSHPPVAGVDDAPIDAGAPGGAPLPSDEAEHTKGKLQRRNHDGVPEKGFDPDVLSD